MSSRPVAVNIPLVSLIHPLIHFKSVMLGATNPLASAPGTIRGDYAIVTHPPKSNYSFVGMLTVRQQDVGRNVCHGSDSVESAKKEIALWFSEGELMTYESPVKNWVYE